jgi:hypothetical protein
VPLSSTSEGIILPERERGEFLGHQDPSEVGMALEPDAVHVEDLALHPVGPQPERDGRRDGRVRIADPDLHDQSFVSDLIEEHVMHLESRLSGITAGVLEIVHPSQFDQLKSGLVAEGRQGGDQLLGSEVDPDVVSKPTGRERPIAEGTGQYLEGLRFEFRLG